MQPEERSGKFVVMGMLRWLGPRLLPNKPARSEWIRRDPGHSTQYTQIHRDSHQDDATTITCCVALPGAYHATLDACSMCSQPLVYARATSGCCWVSQWSHLRLVRKTPARLPPLADDAHHDDRLPSGGDMSDEQNVLELIIVSGLV